MSSFSRKGIEIERTHLVKRPSEATDSTSRRMHGLCGSEGKMKVKVGAVRDTYILEREGSASRFVRAGSDDERSG